MPRSNPRHRSASGQILPQAANTGLHSVNSPLDAPVLKSAATPPDSGNVIPATFRNIRRIAFRHNFTVSRNCDQTSVAPMFWREVPPTNPIQHTDHRAAGKIKALKHQLVSACLMALSAPAHCSAIRCDGNSPLNPLRTFSRWPTLWPCVSLRSLCGGKWTDLAHLGAGVMVENKCCEFVTKLDHASPE